MIDRVALLFMMICAWLYMTCLFIVAIISPVRARKEIAAMGKTLGAPPSKRKRRAW